MAWNTFLAVIPLVMSLWLFRGRRAARQPAAWHDRFVLVPIAYVHSRSWDLSGRFPRFNSWDVITDPLRLLAYVVRMVGQAQSVAMMGLTFGAIALRYWLLNI